LNHDGTRTVVDYDEKHHPLKVANWSEYGSVAGTTVEGYYPVTYKPRFSSKSDYNSDLVSYFHEDGSLWYKLDIGTSTVTVKYFDQTGTRELLEQMWWRHEVTTNGVTHVTYSLYTLAFWDDQGNKTRSMSFSEKGVVDFETLYDVTVGGVKYKELDNFYNPDGTLKETRYWIGEAHFPPDKIEPHQVQENIRAQVPADALTMHVQIDDDLPIPPPQTGPEGY
jgi:hypothetical protein